MTRLARHSTVRTPIDDSWFIGEDDSDDPRDRQIEVVIQRAPFLFPGLGYEVVASIGILTTVSFCFTRWGAQRVAQREFNRLKLERDGRGLALERLVDDPANPEPTPAELTRARNQQAMEEWDSLFNNIQPEIR